MSYILKWIWNLNHFYVNNTVIFYTHIKALLNYNTNYQN